MDCSVDHHAVGIEIAASLEEMRATESAIGFEFVVRWEHATF
jgi:hypothetical protein